jgi:glycerol-3-phosphate acyltransferase PlsY
MEYIIVIVLGYFIGTLSPALLITKKVKNIDIREVNSMNAGTSNVAMTLGLKYGVIVGILDILKGLIPVLLLRIIFPENEIIWIVGGLSAIIGHVYPFYMEFRGGKGTATFGGMCIALFPLQSIVLAILFFVILKISDYITIATMFVIIIIPIGMYFYDYHYISIILVSIYSLLSFYKHIPNLVRIVKKEETGLKEGLRKK